MGRVQRFMSQPLLKNLKGFRDLFSDRRFHSWSHWLLNLWEKLLLKTVNLVQLVLQLSFIFLDLGNDDIFSNFFFRRKSFSLID